MKIVLFFLRRGTDLSPLIWMMLRFGCNTTKEKLSPLHRAQWFPLFVREFGLKLREASGGVI